MSCRGNGGGAHAFLLYRIKKKVRVVEFAQKAKPVAMDALALIMSVESPLDALAIKTKINEVAILR